MLQSRLQKRVRSLGLKSFDLYCDYLFSPEGMEREMVQMIDAVTTNKTDFFREEAQFDYLVEKALPELINVRGAGVKKKLAVWSAGCSTGEEPYTLAMALSEFAKKWQGFYYSILATDISTRVLEKASLGIYEEEKVASVPFPLRKKYLLRGKDKNKGLVRIVPELRELVKFRKLNLMENDFSICKLVDIIFCRNVMIYFDKKTQEDLINRFCRHLSPGAYIFMGYAETLNGMNVSLIQAAPSVYKKPG